MQFSITKEWRVFLMLSQILLMSSVFCELEKKEAYITQRSSFVYSKFTKEYFNGIFQKKMTSGYLEKDPNILAWKDSRKYIEAISHTMYEEVSKAYKTEQILAINSGYDYICSHPTYPAKYEILVLIDIHNGCYRKAPDTTRIFILIENLIKNEVKIEKLVFYNVNSFYPKKAIKKAVEKSRKYPVPEIEFYSTDTILIGNIVEYFLNIFSDVKSTIVSNLADIQKIGDLDEKIISTIVGLKTGVNGIKRIQKNSLNEKLINLQTITVTDFYLNDIELKKGMSIQYSKPLRVKNLCIEQKVLDYYNSEDFSLFSYVVPTETLCILISSRKDVNEYGVSDFHAKKIEEGFSCITDSLNIRFRVSYEDVLTPDLMRYILTLLCKTRMHAHRIYIERLPSSTREDYSVLQIPLYYSAESKEDMEKLERCKILISLGKNQSDIQLRPVPSLTDFSEKDRYYVIGNLTTVMRKREFKKLLDSPPDIHSLPKNLPGSLSLLYNGKLEKNIECMHCSKRFFQCNGTFLQDEMGSVMLYSCGHASCGTCGYKHTSQGFKEPPKCKVCDTLINGTMLYVKNDEEITEDTQISPTGLETMVCDVLDYKTKGFIFSYGTSDSSILFGIGSIFTFESDLKYSWSKSKDERSFIYLMESDKENRSCSITIDHIKKELILDINTSFDGKCTEAVTIHICRKLSFNAESSVDATEYFEILFSGINTEDFLFLYKCNPDCKFRYITIKKIEERILGRVHEITELCNYFWITNRWV